MRIYTQESLEALRQRVDIIDVISPYIDLKKSGASYKGLCPFHDERSPSFMVQKGDNHYHCFGCGAHGDSIQFLINHNKLSFNDAVETLAERYQITLDLIEGGEKETGPNKKWIKEALTQATKFYQFQLLYSQEGNDALNYLYVRKMDTDFITTFEIGYAPQEPHFFRKYMHSIGFNDEVLEGAGLISLNYGKEKEFFIDRIVFPVKDPMGQTIGFSARKYKEETFGGKYINTSETVLFKKSKILFGLNYSRRRIAKERRVIIVEGQIDALKVIHQGLNLTVASLGTAFGEFHAKELQKLGVVQVYIAMDSDQAGQEAARKVGHLFQKLGIEVKVVQLPQGSDPDSFIQQFGIEEFKNYLEQAIDFIPFIVQLYSKKFNTQSPSGKMQLVEVIKQEIADWDQPILVQESLKSLASILNISLDLIGNNVPLNNIYIKRSAYVGEVTIDPNQILEMDFLRWIILQSNIQPQFFEIAQKNVTIDDLKDSNCKEIYKIVFDICSHNKKLDFLTIASKIVTPGAQKILQEINQKIIQVEKGISFFQETVQKILNRNWMEKRELIKMKIQSGVCSDDEALELLKQFEALKPPHLV
ncbi:MAG: DNA primase [Chlamydia sp. 32-24]|nr:MAG: DNA primase [Chlamydia sp. 32-24]